MALDSSSLADALKKVFEAPAADFVSAAKNWADAYAEYATSAQSCQLVPPVQASIDAAHAVLQATLATAFAAGVDPVSTSSAMSSAFTSFWFTPPVAFEGVTPGVVTAVAGTAVLEAGLLASWAANTADQADAGLAAEEMATLLDAFTHTVVVTHAPPSACATPLV